MRFVRQSVKTMNSTQVKQMSISHGRMEEPQRRERDPQREVALTLTEASVHRKRLSNQQYQEQTSCKASQLQTAAAVGDRRWRCQHGSLSAGSPHPDTHRCEALATRSKEDWHKLKDRKEKTALSFSLPAPSPMRKL